MQRSSVSNACIQVGINTEAIRTCLMLLPGELNFAYQSATAVNMFLQPTSGPSEITL